MASKITLSKTVLANIPIYSMPTTLPPVSVCDSIDAHIWKFIWGLSQSQRKIHLVLWNDVCSSKEDGSLGLQQSRLMNEALMMKLAFAILRDKDTLWIKVLRSKYRYGDFTFLMVTYKHGDLIV